MKLQPEDFQKLETKKLANVIRKLHEGKTLTGREEAILAAAKASEPQTSGNSAPAAPAVTYAKTWDELAQALGAALGHTVTRRSLQEWRKDPRYNGKWPQDRADGRKEVAAWLRFMVENGLRRADEVITDDDEEGAEGANLMQPPAVGGSQAQWKLAILALDHRRKENDIYTGEEKLLVATELEGPIGAMLAAFQGKLTQFPDTAARRVKGLRDEAECRDVLRDEMDGVLSDLSLAEFTAADAVASAVENLSLDAEAEALCGKLLFGGADRPALLQLAAAIAAQAIRDLGRGAIRKALRNAETPDTAIADAATGQVTDAATESNALRRNSSSPPVPPAAPSEAPDISPRPAKAPARKPRKKAKARTRPQPTPAPGEQEGAIHPAPRKKRRG